MNTGDSLLVRPDEFAGDIADVNSIKAIPTILDIVCRTTKMRFAAVARVTEDRWVACSVRDYISFGLKPGDELDVKTTICHEIRHSGKPVIIDHVAANPVYAAHHTPQIYGLQSYISMPILLTNGIFFGTLCAIDPEPHLLNTPETIAMFEMFADVIGLHLSTIDRLRTMEATLLVEQQNSALREQFIAVLGHDLRNPLAAIDGGMQMLAKTPLNDKAATIVKLVRGSTARMAGLIDNVMDFARGRLGGGLTLHCEAMHPIEPLLRQVIAELQITAPGRAIETSFTLTAAVICDRLRIMQLVSNLLGNALAYGAPASRSALSRPRTGTFSNSPSPMPVSRFPRRYSTTSSARIHVARSVPTAKASGLVSTFRRKSPAPMVATSKSSPTISRRALPSACP